MPNLKYSKADFETSVNELVPDYQKTLVHKAFDLDSAVETDFDDIGLMLTGEKRSNDLWIYTAAPVHGRVSMWAHIKAEIYDYLCTSSKKYSKERKEAGSTIKTVITIISTAVASQFSVALGVISGAVTVALMSALKIGQNAWCAAYGARLEPQ